MLTGLRFQFLNFSVADGDHLSSPRHLNVALHIRSNISLRWGPYKKLLSYLAPSQVNVNGTEYMGSVAVNDKKKAKANAAMYCLQTMGLVPKDPDNPV